MGCVILRRPSAHPRLGCSLFAGGSLVLRAVPSPSAVRLQCSKPCGRSKYKGKLPRPLTRTDLRRQLLRWPGAGRGAGRVRRRMWRHMPPIVPRAGPGPVSYWALCRQEAASLHTLDAISGYCRLIARGFLMRPWPWRIELFTIKPLNCVGAASSTRVLPKAAASARSA